MTNVFLHRVVQAVEFIMRQSEGGCKFLYLAFVMSGVFVCSILHFQ